MVLTASAGIVPCNVSIMIKQNISFLQLHSAVSFYERKRICTAAEYAKVVVVAACFPFRGYAPCSLGIHISSAESVDILIYKCHALPAFLTVGIMLIYPVYRLVGRH